MLRRVTLAICAFLLGTAASAESVTAVLEPARSVELRSTVNGRVTDIVQLEGTIVQENEIVAEIDASVQRARVDLAKVSAEALGTLDRAQQLLEQAEFRRDRMATAREKGAAQSWEVEMAEQTVSVARADLQVAKDELERRSAELSLEQATLSEFSVRAPFDATVLNVAVDKGEIVDTASVLVELGALDKLEATAFLPVDWALKLRDGVQLQTSIENGSSVEASIAAIDPRIDPASRTVRVVIEVLNAESGLRPGEILVVEEPL